MKKILFIVSNLGVGGGAEKSTAMLTKALSEGFDIEILTFYNFKEEYEYNCIRHSFNDKYSTNILIKLFRFFIKYPLKLKHFLKKNKYDLVVSNAEDANITCLFTKKYLFNFKLWTVIRNDIFRKDHPYHRFRLWHKNADKAITLTKALQRKANFEAVAIPNALDFSYISKQAKKTPPYKFHGNKNILMIGRLAAQKNYKLAIDIMKDMPDYNLYILGDGPLKSELNEKTKDMENVTFLGKTINPYAYLKACDLFLLTSNHEGMPRVLMEALAVGTKAVANDCPTGPRELLEVPLEKKLTKYEKTKYGYLVPYNNKEEFKKAITRALSSKEKPKPDQRYDLKKVAKKWREEIERS